MSKLFGPLIIATVAIASSAQAATPVVCNLLKIQSSSVSLKQWVVDPAKGEFKIDEMIEAENLRVSMSGDVRSFAVFQLTKDGYASWGTVARQPSSFFDADLSISAPDMSFYNLQCRGDR